MIIKILKHLFLICTSISILSSVLIEACNLQYDDNGIGGVIFLVSFITGFVRFLVHEIMGLLSWGQQGIFVESMLSVLTAITLDFCMSSIINKLSKNR